MSADLVLDLIHAAMATTLGVAGPLLVTALIVGVLVSVVQAVTQIQEQTLTFVPKVAAIALVLFALLPWLMRQLVSFLVQVIETIPALLS